MIFSGTEVQNTCKQCEIKRCVPVTKLADWTVTQQSYALGFLEFSCFLILKSSSQFLLFFCSLLFFQVSLLFFKIAPVLISPTFFSQLLQLNLCLTFFHYFSKQQRTLKHYHIHTVEKNPLQMQRNADKTVPKTEFAIILLWNNSLPWY